MKKLLSTISLMTILSTPSFGTEPDIGEWIKNSSTEKSVALAQRNEVETAKQKAICAREAAKQSYLDRLNELTNIFKDKTVNSALALYKKTPEELIYKIKCQINTQLRNDGNDFDVNRLENFDIVNPGDWKYKFTYYWQLKSNAHFVHFHTKVIDYAREKIIEMVKSLTELKDSKTIRGT